MRIIAIGDIHGRDIWKEIVENEADKYVFIGDYLDTHENINPFRQEQNFEEILQFKRDNMDKVVLLIGNHDYHYFSEVARNGIRYSGFQGHMLPKFSAILDKATTDGLIQLCYVHEDIIFSHAGFSKTFCREVLEIENIDKSFQENVNNQFLKNIFKFGFIYRGFKTDYYGNNEFQSPIWIRPESLLYDKLESYRQVVGHTSFENIIINDGIAFIDVFSSSAEYLLIEDGIFKPIKL